MTGDHPAAFPLVSLKGTYFQRNGHPFLPVGAHWVPAKAALHWPYQWEPEEVEADFAKMRDLGFNTVRFDLFWAWFEPHPGEYNPAAFEQLDYLIGLAYRHQIYLHPTLFIGGEVGEAFWDVPWRNGRHPHADPEMLRLQTDHAAEFARRYCAEPAILAWDLTDEPPYWIVSGQTTDAMAINWTRLIAGAMRRYDPDHLLCVGTSMEDVHHGPFRPDNLKDEVDFFTAHPYSIYTLDRFPDPMLSERGTYCGTFQVALSSGAGRPVMVHELGASSAQYAPESVAAFDRVTLYSSLAAGSNGFLLWCFTDAAPETYHRVPYLRAPHETQFGLTTWDRQDRPAGAELRQFSRLVEQLDLTGLEPAPAEAAIVVPDEWAKPHGDFSRFGLGGTGLVPYFPTQDGGALPGDPLPGTGELNVWLTGALLSTLILTRRAGYKPAFPREYTAWQTHPAVFAPSPLTSTEHNLVHVHTRFWETAREYVAGGGALYASLCADAAIPEMADLFGARLVDHMPVETACLRMVAPFGGIDAGETFTYRLNPASPQHWPATLSVEGGQVIAVDQDGRPALVTNRVGSGHTLLCAYPIESYLAAQPVAFEGAEPTHRLYRAFLEWAGIKPLFRTDQPSVEVGALGGLERGYAVLANHRPEAVRVRLATRLEVKTLQLLDPQGGLTDLEEAEGSGREWLLDIGGHQGAIVAWRS